MWVRKEERKPGRRQNLRTDLVIESKGDLMTDIDLKFDH